MPHSVVGGHIYTVRQEAITWVGSMPDSHTSLKGTGLGKVPGLFQLSKDQKYQTMLEKSVICADIDILGSCDHIFVINTWIQHGYNHPIQI